MRSKCGRRSVDCRNVTRVVSSFPVILLKHPRLAATPFHFVAHKKFLYKITLLIRVARTSRDILSKSQETGTNLEVENI